MTKNSRRSCQGPVASLHHGSSTLDLVSPNADCCTQFIHAQKSRPGRDFAEHHYDQDRNRDVSETGRGESTQPALLVCLVTRQVEIRQARELQGVRVPLLVVKRGCREPLRTHAWVSRDDAIAENGCGTRTGTREGEWLIRNWIESLACGAYRARKRRATCRWTRSAAWARQRRLSEPCGAVVDQHNDGRVGREEGDRDEDGRDGREGRGRMRRQRAGTHVKPRMRAREWFRQREGPTDPA
jgi:hypothetical protein